MLKKGVTDRRQILYTENVRGSLHEVAALLTNKNLAQFVLSLSSVYDTNMAYTVVVLRMRLWEYRIYRDRCALVPRIQFDKMLEASDAAQA